MVDINIAKIDVNRHKCRVLAHMYVVATSNRRKYQFGGYGENFGKNISTDILEWRNISSSEVVCLGVF